MAVLQPTLAILDETDSGLDIDALRVVADGVNALRSPERAFIVVTHYQRLLEYIVPDHVHVLSDGRIVQSGGRELALELEAKGYGWLEGAAGGSAPVTSTAQAVDWIRSRPAAASARGRPSGWPRTAPPRSSASRRPGFPTTRLEAWRFTNIAPIAGTAFELAAPEAEGADDAGGGSTSCATAPPRPSSSTAASTSSCRPRRCRWASSSTGSPAASRTRTRPRRPSSLALDADGLPFAALNAAFLEDGVHVRDSRGRGADRADPHPGGDRFPRRRR